MDEPMDCQALTSMAIDFDPTRTDQNKREDECNDFNIKL